MIPIPRGDQLMLYGPAMVNVESDPVYLDEYSDLADLRGYMVEMMLKHNGIGLAAPQVGIFKQFFVMMTNEGDIIDLVNPEIAPNGMWGIARMGYEACLSIPPNGNGCRVERCDHVRIVYSTSQSEERTERVFSFLDSRVAQHEMDHLTGTFFIDRAHPKWKRIVLDEYMKWKRGQNEKINA